MEVLSNIVDKVGIRLPEGGLESWVDPGNPHFSEGEKQVYALARAVLNKQPVVILDEATSCIDAEKEQRMKEVIHSEFDGLLIASESLICRGQECLVLMVCDRSRAPCKHVTGL